MPCSIEGFCQGKRQPNYIHPRQIDTERQKEMVHALPTHFASFERVISTSRTQERAYTLSSSNLCLTLATACVFKSCRNCARPCLEYLQFLNRHVSPLQLIYAHGNRHHLNCEDCSYKESTSCFAMVIYWVVAITKQCNEPH